MKLRELESGLQGVQGFQEPKAELEQYVTTPHLAAQLVHTMDSDFDDVEDKMVCDLGCGSGMLSVATAFGGAAHVTGVDVDADALELAEKNSAEHGCDHVVDFVRGDLCTNVFNGQRVFDTVVMNPPFGTKRKGVDILFLHTALNLARSAVYSMHKTSTRSFVEKKFRTYGVEATVLAKMQFNIGRTYAFQKKKSVDIEVDLWRFDVTKAVIIPSSDTVVNVASPLELIGSNSSGVYSTRDRKMRKQRGGKNR